MLTAALEWTGTAERIVLASALVVALGVLWRYLVRPIWRFVDWLRHEIRDEIARRKSIDALLQREFTANSGSSMKDHTALAAEQAALLGNQVLEIRNSQDALGVAQSTLARLLDKVVERKETDHDQIWQALSELGAGRRHDDPPEEP